MLPVSTNKHNHPNIRDLLPALLLFSSMFLTGTVLADTEHRHANHEEPEDDHGKEAQEYTIDGASIYLRFCSVCHGDRGDGNSHARSGLNPPPRDFTDHLAIRELTPTRIREAIKNGVVGTAMVAWSSRLDNAQVDAVSRYIAERFISPANTESIGSSIYARSCSVCHGDDGRGARWASAGLDPKPRNFRASAPDQLTHSAMVDAVKHGREGTAMVAYARQLDDPQINAVVTYIRERFMNVVPITQGTGNTLAVPAAEQKHAAHGHRDHVHSEHGETDEIASDLPLSNQLTGDAGVGEAFYRMNCATCHGEKGDGNGRRAYFIFPKPANFLDPVHRSHLTRDALFEAVSDGVRGKEMPAWKTVLTPQEIANVVEYVYNEFVNPSHDH